MPLNCGATFTFLGHATILIETSQSKRILIDPWLNGNPVCPPEWRNLERIGPLDLVLLTHIHNDHAGDAETVIRANPQCEVVANADVCVWLETKGLPNLRPMNKGGMQILAGIEIHMTDAVHSSSFVEANGSVVYGGEPGGYVLVLENGFTVYDAGDTALFGDMALIKTLYHPDLAILPIGDLYTMGPRQAAYAIRLLGVEHMIPIHYGTFPALIGTPEALKSQTDDLPDLTIHALQPGDSLS